MTTQDGTTVQTYTVGVTRAPDTSFVVPPSSNNANLSELSFSGGIELNPAFKPEINSYTTETDYNVDQVSVTLNLSHEKATAIVKVNGGAPEVAANGIASGSLPLIVGTNRNEVIVTAEDGTIRSYNIIVTHQADAGTGTDTESESGSGAQASECPFTDIRNHWAETEICEAYALVIVQGMGANIFAADTKVTRTELAVMLLRTLQISNREHAGTATFNDQESIPEWAQSAIITGAVKGILEGYPDGTFRPQQPIIRSEMAAMIARAMKWEPTSEEHLAFADSAGIPSWARVYVEAVYVNGLMQGRVGEIFAPYDLATRAEAAVVLLRL